MKYLKKFDTQAEYETYVGGGDYVTPNVSFIEHTSTQEEQQVRFQPYIPPPYLTFTAEQADSTVKLSRFGSSTSLANAVLQYSIDDGGTWNDYTLGTNITLTNVGDSVKFKGINTTLGIEYPRDNYHKFIMTGKIKASGDVTSLLNENGGDVALAEYCFMCLFMMCTSLVQAPELPSTTMTSYCYGAMFKDCTGLTTAPNLPATTLAYMCYANMFAGCTSLTQAPALTVMTLVNRCYYYMFYSCTSLTQAPELPATTLATECYSNMFRDCHKLNYIKAMFITNTPAYDYTGNWVNSVGSPGMFVKNSAATWDVTGTDGVPSGWSVQTAAA